MVCNHCGATVESTDSNCPRCAVPLPRSCPACGHENAPGANFCNACGTRLSPAAATPATAAPAGAAPQAERRQLTVMFCDLVGSTALSTRLDPEDLRDVMSAYHECVAAVVGGLGGYVAQYLGDGALVYFGYPHASENDAERATHAALALIAAVRALRPLGQLLSARVGIATGPVVVGEIIGPPGRGERGAVGEVLNLAARLQGLAQPDGVVLAHATHQLLGPRFDCEDLGAHDLKGFAEPVPVWRVRGAAQGDGHALPGWSRGPMAGRRAERRRLQAELQSCATQGRGRVVCLSGDAGLGKTRLLQAFMASARRQGFGVHTGQVLDFGTGAGRDALGALARDLLGLAVDASSASAAGGGDALRRAVAERAVAPDEAPFLHDLLGLPHPPGLRGLYDAMDLATRAAGRRAAMAGLVRHASASRPRLLAVEDLHWADAATRTQLAALAADIAAHPVLLVLTARPQPPSLDAAWRAALAGTPLLDIELGPLQPEEAALLVRPWLAGRADVAQRCIERAAGNPLFLEQLLRNAAEGEAQAVPASVQALVQARLDRLEPEHKRALQAACVLGQRFDADALAHLLEAPTPAPERLLAHGMVQWHGDGFLFEHALVREAIYDGLLRSRRQALHRRAAQWFAQRDASLRAAHLDRAHDPAAAQAYLEAAHAQRHAYRHAAARTLAERGLELAPDAAQRFELGCLLGDILQDLGEMRAALAAYEQAAGAADDDARRCRAWIGCAQVKRVIDDLDGAFADLARAQALAGALPAEAARLHFLRGNLYFPRGDIAGCIREHTRSLELARQIGAAALEAEALGGLGDAAYMQGRMLSALAHFEACIERAEAHGLARIACANRPMAGVTRWFAGDIRAALEQGLAAIEAARRIGHLRAEMIGQHVVWFCLHDLARYDAALPHAERGVELARQLQAPRFEAEGLACRAQAQYGLGQRSAAQATIREALAISRRSGMAYFGSAVLGIAAWIFDDAAERRAALAEGPQRLAEGAVSHNHLLFGRGAIEACLQLGDWDGAEAHAARLADYTRAEPLPWSQHVIARGRALARAGRDPQSPGLAPVLRGLVDEADALGYAVGQPALLAALAELPPQP